MRSAGDDTPSTSVASEEKTPEQKTSPSRPIDVGGAGHSLGPALTSNDKVIAPPSRQDLLAAGTSSQLYKESDLDEEINKILKHDEFSHETKSQLIIQLYQKFYQQNQHASQL